MTHSGKYTGKNSSKKYRLTQRDLQVPVMLEDYKMLTTSQIQKLLYPSKQKAQTRMLLIFKSGLIKRFPYPVLISESGKGEYVYYTGKRQSATLLAIRHLICLNEIRIEFELACRKSEFIKLRKFIPEYRGRLNSNG